MQMEVQGNHTDLFLNDLHKHTHGCPKFVAMTMEERVQVGTAAKLCLSCISHTVTFSHTHLTECKRRKQAKSGDKSEYACQVDRCNFNICTCVRHKADPAHASTLTKRKAQMTQRGLTVGMVTIMPTIPTNTQPWGGGQACLPHHTPTAAQLDSFNSIQTDSEDSRVKELVSNTEKDGTRVKADTTLWSRFSITASQTV